MNIVLLRVESQVWDELSMVRAYLGPRRVEPGTKKEGTGGSTSGQKKSPQGGGKWQEGLPRRRNLNAD